MVAMPVPRTVAMMSVDIPTAPPVKKSSI
jgi:hypothetical protein